MDNYGCWMLLETYLHSTFCLDLIYCCCLAFHCFDIWRGLDILVYSYSCCTFCLMWTYSCYKFWLILLIIWKNYSCKYSVHRHLHSCRPSTSVESCIFTVVTVTFACVVNSTTTLGMVCQKLRKCLHVSCPGLLCNTHCIQIKPKDETPWGGGISKTIHCTI